MAKAQPYMLVQAFDDDTQMMNNSHNAFHGRTASSFTL